MKSNSSFKALQDAAQAISLEESRELSSEFLKAADQIAEERGLSSPRLEKKKTTTANTSSPTLTAEVGPGAVSSPETVSNLKNVTTTEEDDVNALLANMGSAVTSKAMPILKQDSTINDSDDAAVQALLNSTNKVNDALKKKNAMISSNTQIVDGKKSIKFVSAGPLAEDDVRKSQRDKENRIKYLKKLEKISNSISMEVPSTAEEKVDSEIDSRRNSNRIYDAKSSHVSSSSSPSSSSSSRNTPIVKTEQSKIARLLNSKFLNSDGERECKESFQLSSSQEMLFRSMKTARPLSARSATRNDNDTENNNHNKNNISRNAKNKKKKLTASEKLRVLNNLTQPTSFEPTAAMKKKDPTLQYSLYDDAKECTFKPKLHGNPSSESKGGSGSGEDYKSTFIERQEAEERTRRLDLEFRIGKKAYDALLDKKFCSSCGAKQSYDEVKEKRKKCPNCQVEYRAKTTWTAVEKSFFQREKMYARKAEEERIKKAKEIEDDYIKSTERRQYDRVTGKVVVVSGAESRVIWDEEAEKEFFQRMEQTEKKRQEKIKEIEDNTYGKTCTFKPVTKHRNKDGEEDDENENDEGGNNADKVSAFLSRMEGDLENRKAATPHKFSCKRPPNEFVAFKA